MYSIKSRAVVKLILIVCFLSLVFLFVIRENMRADLLDFFNAMKINIGNIERELFPQRRRPFSLVRQESELKIRLPNPFVNFSPSDWRKFWELVYASVGYDIPDNPRLPIIKRQLTLAELEEKLMEQFPIFEKFQAQHWEEFWRVIFRKRRFKR